MDDCADNYPNENPQGYDINFLANNFDVFLVGDFSEASYRIPNVVSYISQIKAINPDAKFVYYSHFHQLIFDEPSLNLNENNFMHSSDPASLTLAPTSNGIIINFQKDRRNEYTNNFIANSYNIYKSTDGNSFSLLTNTRENVYMDNNVGQGIKYYYKVKTVKQGSSTDYDYSYSQSIINNVATFYAYNGTATITSKNIDTHIYDILFTLNTNQIADQVYVYMDLDNDWIFDTNEKFAMSYNNRYELTKNINLRSSRSWIQSNIEYGIPYFFEVIKNMQSYYLPADSRINNNTYLTTLNNRIKNRIYASYGLNLKSDGWRQFYINHVQQVNNAQTLDGVYVDEAKIQLLYFGDARPYDLTQQELDSSIRSMSTQLRNTYPNKLIFYNTLDLINLNSEGLDGGLIEGYGTEWNGNYNTNLWIDHQNKVIQSEREGLSFMLPINLNNEQKRMFMLSSYLLVKGDGSYLWYNGWQCPTQSSFYQEAINKDINSLGNPTGNYPSSIQDLLSNGIYKREYENGLVLVNPTSSSIIYSLSKAYNDTILSGNSITKNQVSNSITISPNTAKILTFSPLIQEPQCQSNWICNSWSQCLNNNQTRICNDSNNCSPPTSIKPSESQSCTMPPECTTDLMQQCSYGSSITIKRCVNGFYINTTEVCSIIQNQTIPPQQNNTIPYNQTQPVNQTQNQTQPPIETPIKKPILERIKEFFKAFFDFLIFWN